MVFLVVGLRVASLAREQDRHRLAVLAAAVRHDDEGAGVVQLAALGRGWRDRAGGRAARRRS